MPPDSIDKTSYRIACADRLHARSRDTFAAVVRGAQALKAQGVDNERVVTELVTQLGVAILDCAGTEEFWESVWSVCGALAYAAINEGGKP